MRNGLSIMHVGTAIINIDCAYVVSSVGWMTPQVFLEMFWIFQIICSDIFGLIKNIFILLRNDRTSELNMVCKKIALTLYIFE